MNFYALVRTPSGHALHIVNEFREGRADTLCQRWAPSGTMTIWDHADPSAPICHQCLYRLRNRIVWMVEVSKGLHEHDEAARG